MGAAPSRLSTHTLTTSLVDPTTTGGTLRGGRTQLRVNVLLPAAYASSPGRRFPVLYLLHGADGGYDDYERELHVSRLLADFPGIVVMPDAGTYSNYIDWWSGGTRGTQRWETYLSTELRSWIHSHYRVLPDRRWHAVAGLSGGGQGALRLATDLPGYFGSVMGMSAAMPNMQDPGTYALFDPVLSQKAGTLVRYEDVYGPLDGWYATATNPFPRLAQLRSSRVYLSWGDGTNCPGDPVNPQSIAADVATEKTIQAQDQRYADALKDAGVDGTAHQTCGVHTWRVWGRALADAVQHWGFFRAVPTPTTWTVTLALPVGSAWDVSFRRLDLPQDALVLQRRADGSLRATGTGQVRLRQGRCVTTLRMPATWVPAGCS